VRPARLLVYDDTCRPGLSNAWAAGSWLYRRLGRIDEAHPATSWADALVWLATATPDRPIAEVQYWGHGNWGCAKVGDDVLDARALEPGHALYPLLARVRARLVPGGRALWWWRTCETFGARAGHDFAIRWTRFLDCTSAGHTYVIGVWQSGLRVLRPGEEPAWSPTEGLRDGTADAPVTARRSSPAAPSTITCFTGAIP
jgi:hypothetical protein